jgi:hypothetical protein
VSPEDHARSALLRWRGDPPVGDGELDALVLQACVLAAAEAALAERDAIAAWMENVLGEPAIAEDVRDNAHRRTP